MCLDWSNKSLTAWKAQVRYNLKGHISRKHPRSLNYMEADRLRSSKPWESLETFHVSIYISVSLMHKKTLTIYYWFIDNQVLSLKSRPGTSVTVGFIIDVELLRQKRESISLATQEFGSYTTVILNGDIEVSESKKRELSFDAMYQIRETDFCFVDFQTHFQKAIWELKLNNPTQRISVWRIWYISSVKTKSKGKTEKCNRKNRCQLKQDIQMISFVLTTRVINVVILK